MADDFLPPVTARLAINIADFLSGLDQAKAALARFAAEARELGDIQLKATLDTTELREDARVAAAEAAADVAVGVSVDEARLAEDVRAATEQARAAAGDISIGTETNTTGLSEEIRLAAEQASTDITVTAHADVSAIPEEVSIAAAETSAASEITVPVTADSDGLAEEVATAAEEAQAGENITVPVEADSGALAEETHRAVEEAQAGEKISVPVEAQAVDLDHLQETGQKVTVPVTIDTTTGEAQVGAFSRDLQERITAAIKSLPSIDLTADPTQAEARISEIRAELADLTTKRIGIDVDPVAAREQIRSLAAELDSLSGDVKDIRLVADTTVAATQLDGIKRQLDSLSGERIEIDTTQARADVGAFAEDLQARITAAIKALPAVEITAGATDIDTRIAEIRTELEELSHHTIGLDLDATEVRTQIRELAAELDDLSRNASSIQVEADTATAATKLDGIKRQLDDLTGKRIDVDLDTAEAEENVGKLAADIQTTLKAAVKALPSIELTADTAEVNQRIAEIRAELAAISDKTIGVDISTDKALAEIALLSAKLDELRSKSISIEAKADTGAAVSALRALTSEADKAGEDAATGFIDRFVSSVESGKLKVGNIDLNPGAGQFMVPIDLIIPAIADLGQLTGILGLIPALFTGAATAAGTFAVGIKDVSDAEKAYQAIEKQQDQQSAKTAADYAQQLSTQNSIINAQNAVTNSTQAYADAQRKAAEDVAKAQQDVQDATQNLANAQRTAANDIINATQAVARAKQDEARAEQTAAQNNENALRAEQQAEQQLSNAQMAATRAQLALTDARQAASRSIEDLQHRVADDALSVQAATLNIQQAQVDLNRTLSDPAATELQREQAQLNYQQQVQQLSDIQLQYQRAQEDSAKATAAGVDGSRQVINAQDSLTQAQQRVIDATNAVGEAQEKIVITQQAGMQAIADAQQKVADSERALTNTQIDGAERVKKAQQDLANVQLKLNDTRISSSESVTKALQQEESAQRSLQVALAQQKAHQESLNSATAAYQVVLDKLAPSARAAVEALNAITGPKSPFEDLHLDVQQRMFAGVGDEIRRIAVADLPVLRTGMDGMADAINRGFHNIGDFLTAPASAKDWQEIFTNIDTAANELVPAIQPILRIFTDLVAVGSEFLPGLADSFAKGAQSAADFVHNARETGQLHEWIQEGINAFRTLWGIVVDLGHILKDIFVSPGDTGLLTVAKGLLDVLTWILDHAPIVITLIEGIFITVRIVSWLSTIRKAIDTITAFGSKVKEWATGSAAADAEVTTAAEDAARRQAAAAEEAAAAQKLAAEQSTLAVKQMAVAMEEAALQMRAAYAEIATGTEAAELRVQIADDEAALAAQKEALATEEAALRVKAAYAEEALAAEGAASRIGAANAEAGAAEALGGGRGALGGIGKFALGAFIGGTVADQSLQAILPGPEESFADYSILQTIGYGVETAGKFLSLDIPGAINNIKKAWNDTMAAQDDATGSLKGNINTQQDFIREQQLMESALHAGDAALNSRRTLMMSDIDAQIRWGDELSRITQEVREHGRTVDLNTDAGRRNMEGLQQLSSTAMQNLAAMQQNGATQADVTKKALEYHDKLVAVAQQIGMTKTQADNYVTALNLIPHDKTTAIWSNVTPMTDLTYQYERAIKGVPTDWNTAFTSNVGAQTAALQDYINHIGYLRNLQPIQTVIDVRQQIAGLMHATGGIDIHGMAEGGLRSMSAGIANIVPPNTPTMIGDNTSVNESYIPWEINDRTDAILDATASALGRTILPRGFDFANTVPFLPDVGSVPSSNVQFSTSGAAAPLAVNASGQSNQPPVIQVTVQGNIWTEQELFSRLQTITQQYGVRNTGSGLNYGFATGR